MHGGSLRQVLGSLIVAALIVAIAILVVTAKLGPNSGEDEGRDDSGGGHGSDGGGDDSSGHGQVQIDGRRFFVRIVLPDAARRA